MKSEKKNSVVFCFRRCCGVFSCFICYMTVLITSCTFVGIVVFLISMFFVISDSEDVEIPDGQLLEDSIAITGIIEFENSRRDIQSTIDTVYVRICSIPPSYDMNSLVYRKTYEVNSDGYFNVEISKYFSWVVAFLDTSKNGTDMIIATFSTTSNLHSIYVGSSSAESDLDLGRLTVNTTSNSSFALLDDDLYDSFLSAVGMSSSQASIYATKDTFCLSSMNPDINSDGVLDVEQETVEPHFNLTFTIYTSIVGTPIISIREKTSLITTSNTPNLTCVGGGPVLQIVFDEDYSGFFRGNITKWELSISTTTQSSVSHVEFNNSFTGIEGVYTTGYRNESMLDEFEVIFHTNDSIPTGTYEYQIFDETDDSKSPTFSDVQPFESDSIELHNHLFPFPVFSEDSESGTIDGFSYTWFRYNGSTLGFEETTTTNEVEFHVGKSSFSIQWCNGTSICESKEVFPSQNGYEVSGTLQLTSLGTFSASEIQEVTITTRHVSGVIVVVTIEE